MLDFMLAYLLVSLSCGVICVALVAMSPVMENMPEVVQS